MEKKYDTYHAPYVGCLLGSAFQKLTKELEAELKKEKIGITAREYMILRALYSKDGLQQCEIAEMVGKDKASICRSVSALSNKGLVRTETLSHKCNVAWLTDKSRELEPLIMNIAEQRHEALAKASSQKEIDIFTKVLNAILK